MRRRRGGDDHVSRCGSGSHGRFGGSLLGGVRGADIPSWQLRACEEWSIRICKYVYNISSLLSLFERLALKKNSTRRSRLSESETLRRNNPEQMPTRDQK